MTDAQESAFRKIQDLAREHFTASLFIAEGDVVNEPQEVADRCSDVHCVFHGGYAASIGLARLAELKVYKTQLDSGDTR